MNVASRLALEKAFELAAKAQPPWPIDAILEKAAAIRDFLESEGTTEPLWSRIELLEEKAHHVQQTGREFLTSLRNANARLTALESSQQPKQEQRTSQSRGKVKPSATSGPAATTTTPPDIDISVPDRPIDF